MKILKKIIEFLKQERGVESIEYALVASFISIAAITAMTDVGHRISDTFTVIASTINSAN